MKPTKHASTNFRMIRPFLDAVDASPDEHRRFLSGEYMPLSVESLGYTIHGGKVYSLTHYGEQNGDALAHGLHRHKRLGLHRFHVIDFQTVCGQIPLGAALLRRIRSFLPRR